MAKLCVVRSNDKSPKLFTQARVWLITGRNSPAYSSGVNNPFADIQKTGEAILGVWNACVDEYDDLRVFAVIRNIATQEFTLKRYESSRYITSEYEWKLNSKRNFLGHDKRTGEHLFTWQPSGGQFTAHRHVPMSAVSFRITQRPSLIQPQTVLDTVGFDESWIQGVPRLPSLSDLDADDNAEEDDSDADATEDGENQQGNAL